MPVSSLSKIRKIILLTGILLLLPICTLPISEGHLAGGKTKTEGEYVIQFDTSPSPPISETEIELVFSVQDRDGLNRHNITAAVTIERNGEEISKYPKQFYAFGDFAVTHIFDLDGPFVIILETSDQISSPATVQFDLIIVTPFMGWINAYGGPLLISIILGAIGTYALKIRLIDRKAASPRKSPETKQLSHQPWNIFHYIDNRGILTLSSGIAITTIMVLPWVGELEAQSLAFHMVAEHLGFVAGSLLISFGIEIILRDIVTNRRKSRFVFAVATIYQNLIKVNRRLNAHGVIGVPVAIIILSYWHLPENFDSAVLTEEIHIMMHISFILLGVIVFMNIKAISKGELLIHVFALMTAMVAWGVVLITTPEHLYSSYPMIQQAEAGTAMVAPHPFLAGLLAIHVLARYLEFEPQEIVASLICAKCGQITKHVLDERTVNDNNQASSLRCIVCKTVINLVTADEYHQLQSPTTKT